MPCGQTPWPIRHRYSLSQDGKYCCALVTKHQGDSSRNNEQNSDAQRIDVYRCELHISLRQL